MKKIITLSLLLSLTFAVYNLGDTVSITDQNITLEGCADEWNNEPSNYIGEEFKLADWNGALNESGEYHVIWLEMSASW